ncbi:MAG: Crp/Fnr family transcriptional regulator [Fluviicola sp.]|nr:MAG: Crp/Fnr family transcriptional regulator [Fluviicola sp.]
MENLIELFGISDDLVPQKFKKGHILQSQGDVNSNAYLVKNGLLRSYTIDQKGKEHVFMFAPEDWIISDIESQEFHHPAELYIECLEDSELIILNRKHLASVELNSQQYQQRLNKLSRRIAVLQRRMIGMMSSTAQERYEEFLVYYPNLVGRISQRMIASYLGITPEALSKIRGQIAKNS